MCFLNNTEEKQVRIGKKGNETIEENLCKSIEKEGEKYNKR